MEEEKKTKLVERILSALLDLFVSGPPGDFFLLLPSKRKKKCRPSFYFPFTFRFLLSSRVETVNDRAGPTHPSKSRGPTWAAPQTSSEFS